MSVTDLVHGTTLLHIGHKITSGIVPETRLHFISMHRVSHVPFTFLVVKGQGHPSRSTFKYLACNIHMQKGANTSLVFYSLVYSLFKSNNGLVNMDAVHHSLQYSGRASASPSLDLFITLLSLGVSGYKRSLNDRKQMYTYLQEELNKCAKRSNLRTLNISHNPISCGECFLCYAIINFCIHRIIGHNFD